MAKETNAQVEVAAPAVTSEVATNVKSFESVVKTLIAADNTQVIKGLKIRSVNVVDADTYTSVRLSVDKAVPAYVADGDTGNFVPGFITTLFQSTYALSGLFKNIDELAAVAPYIVSSPKIIGLLLTGATIDVVMEQLTAGSEYVNPFSTNGEPTVIANNTYISHIVGIKLGNQGSKMLDKLVDRILDQALDN